MNEDDDGNPGWGTAPVLSAVAGAVDAAGFLVLFGLFTAHITGNTTGFGVAAGSADWSEAVKRFFAIPVFALATAGGVAVAEGICRRDPTPAGRARALWSLLLVEAALIVVFTVSAVTVGSSGGFAVDTLPFFLVATVAAVAMGTQNAALRRVSGLSVHTTFMTGQLTEASVSFVHWRHAEADLRTAAAAVRGAGSSAGGGGTGEVAHGDPDAPTLTQLRSRRDRARASVRLSLAVWCAYLVGATVCAWAVVNVSRWVVLVPAAVIVAVAVHVARRAGAGVTSSAAS